MSTELTELFKHNLWANLALLDACEELTDEQLDTQLVGTYGSTRDTLVHLAGSEELYMHMMLGKPRPPRREGEAFPGFELLRDLLTTTGREFVNLAQSGTIPASYLDTSSGEVLTGSMIVILVINHATEHRAHINTIFSHLGLEPLELDGWIYGWTHELLTVLPQPKETAT